MTDIASAVLIGLCTYYNPGVMDRVADYRGLSCPDCAGYAAMVDPEWLGQVVWIAPVGRRPEKFLVVDCGRAEHRDAQRRRGLVAEIDFETARRWGMRGPIVVRVSTHGTQRGETP